MTTIVQPAPRAQPDYVWRSARAPAANAYLFPEVERAIAPLGSRLRIVDLGCGNGAIAGRLAALGHDVVGIEPSPEGVRIAREAHPAARFEIGSVYDADLPARLGAPADVVLSLEVIEHLSAPRRLLEAAHAIVRPGGTLIVSTPYHGYVKNLAISLAGGWDRHFHVARENGHLKFFSRRTLSAMVRDVGFDIVALRGVGRAPLLWKSMVLAARRPEGGEA